MARRRDPVSGRLLLEGVHPQVSPITGTVTYRARLSWGPRDRRQHASQTFPTPQAAEDWISDMRADVRHGRRVDASSLSVAEYHAQWFARMRGGWSGSRIKTVTMVWERYGREYFGGMMVQKVTRHDVQRLIDLMASAGLKESTVRTYMVGITSMLDAAVEDGVLQRRVTSRLTYPRTEDVERVTWSPLQMRRFLYTTRDDSRYGPLWAFLIGTGCRLGEALALEWDAVDTDTGVAIIRARIARQHDGTYAPQRGTKTERRGRSVPLEPWLIDVLDAHRARRNGRYVFQEDGDWLRQGRIRWQWEIAVKAAGLPMMRIHDIRHSVASAMIASGVSERIVQEILGHASLRTTMETYTHVAVRTQRQGTGAMAEMLGFVSSEATTSAKTADSASAERQSTGTK